MTHVLKEGRNRNPTDGIKIHHQEIGRVELGQIPTPSHHQCRGLLSPRQSHGVVGLFHLFGRDFIQIGLINEVPTGQGWMAIPAPDCLTHPFRIETLAGRTPRSRNDAHSEAGGSIHVGRIQTSHDQRKTGRMDHL